MASVDANTLDILQVTSLEDREQLLSAVYTELHPPSTFSRTLDSLIGTLTLRKSAPFCGCKILCFVFSVTESSSQSNVETFTATLASMTKSTSAPHVGCLALNRRSLNLRCDLLSHTQTDSMRKKIFKYKKNLKMFSLQKQKPQLHDTKEFSVDRGHRKWWVQVSVKDPLSINTNVQIYGNSSLSTFVALW